MELYEQIAKYAQEHRIEKFEAGDVDDVLLEWATEYARAYQGTFSFMVDMRIQVSRGLSKGQAKGVLNSALAEARFNRPKQRQESIQVVTKEQTAIKQVVPNGTYTVVWPDQTYRTLRVSDDFRPDQSEGSQMVSYLSGSDNERDFTGFAFISGDRVGIWGKYRDDSVLANSLRMLFEDPAEAGYAYAVASGRCYRCGRTLTVPASLTRGLGPVCAELIGV